MLAPIYIREMCPSSTLSLTNCSVYSFRRPPIECTICSVLLRVTELSPALAHSSQGTFLPLYYCYYTYAFRFCTWHSKSVRLPKNRHHKMVTGRASYLLMCFPDTFYWNRRANRVKREIFAPCTDSLYTLFWVDKSGARRFRFKSQWRQ